MKKYLTTVLSILFSLACASVAATPNSSQAAPDLSLLSANPVVPPSTAQIRINESYGKLPLSFEANQGQSVNEVKFLSRGTGYSLFLTATEAVLALSPPQVRSQEQTPSGPPRENTENAVVRMKLLEANTQARVAGVEALPGKSNYFIGKDPEQWHIGIPHFAKVHYQQIYPGIDLVYYGNQRQLEYDFIVAPGKDPTAIKLAFQGVDRLEINPLGDLVLHTPHGELTQHKPFIYQKIRGKRTPIAGHYVIRERHQIGFQIASYDKSKPLVIDPVLSYSTYLGGWGGDFGYGVAVDGNGNAYIGGQTNSGDFPVLTAHQPRKSGKGDAFVTKLNAAGNALVYSTFLGGSEGDGSRGIAVDAAGHAYLVGITRSTDFPVLNASQPSNRGGDDAFVARLNAEGNALVYSGYLGGSGQDFGYGIAVDGNGNAYVAGHTGSSNFPTTTGAFQQTIGGLRDVFVAKVDTDASGAASLLYSTFLGGRAPDRGRGLAVDDNGNVYVTGFTESTDFPTTAGVFQSINKGRADVFVTKLNANGTAPVYSTLLGGSEHEEGRSIAVDGTGNAYVTGFTRSTDFPTHTPLQPGYGGDHGGLNSSGMIFGGDAFVAKLNAGGTALDYSTYLGGSGDDVGRGIVVDNLGIAYVVGETDSTNFPLADALQTSSGGGFDAFVSKLTPAGTMLSYSTYLGGSGNDEAYAIAVDSAGNAYLTGQTNSTDFPTLNPLQAAKHSNYDVFVARFSGSTSPAPADTLQFSAASYSVREGTDSAFTRAITVTRSGGSAGAVAVDFATSDGTAIANSDYTPVSGTLGFAAGETIKTFRMTTIPDAVFEPGETVNLSLGNATGGATLGAQNTATLLILNDDSAMNFSASRYSVSEGNGAATITVRRVGSKIGAASVDYATHNGSAVAGSDYTASSGTINFAAGDNSPKTFTVPIIDDTTAEPNETVNLTLSNPIGTTLGGRSTAVLVILSDD